MGVTNEHTRLTAEEEAELAEIRRLAKIRHEKARRAAATRGRHDFPLFPFEDSWAFGIQFTSEKLSKRIKPWPQEPWHRDMFPNATTLYAHT